MPEPPPLDLIKSPVSEDIDTVNRIIVEHLNAKTEFIHEVSNHIINSGGKRLRPLLTLLSARACGYTGGAHNLLAATIEFIHTATLLHDDVVDNASRRRGRRTARAIWGNDASVLVGDFLYSRAFQMIVESGLTDATRVFADATNVIAEGEIQQLLNRQQIDTSEGRYLLTIACKTAKLFEAAAHVGAIAASAPEPGRNMAVQIGSNIGMAFQLTDDALDYETHKDTGKPTAQDIAEGKPTMPLIHTLSRCSPAEEKLLRAALQQFSGTHDTGMIREAVEIVRASGAIEHTRQQAEIYANKAQEALDELPDSVYKAALGQLAHFAATRDY